MFEDNCGPELGTYLLTNAFNHAQTRSQIFNVWMNRCYILLFLFYTVFRKTIIARLAL